MINYFVSCNSLLRLTFLYALNLSMNLSFPTFSNGNAKIAALIYHANIWTEKTILF